MLCHAGQSESDRHDFKFDLSNLKDPEKICCAFANSQGGFVIVGIKEKGGTFSIEGLDPDNELYGNFLKKLKIEPSLDIPPPKVIDVPNSEKKLYVIEVPKSPKRPHIPSGPDKRYFYKRHGSNCVQMTLEEIRYQIHNYEEKKDKLTLILIELENIKNMIIHQSDLSDGEYNGETFNFDIIDKVVVETYSFLKEDLETITKLSEIKRYLSHLNSEKSKLLSMLVMSYKIEAKIQSINRYREQVKNSMPQMLEYINYINKSFNEKFELVNPYKVL